MQDPVTGTVIVCSCFFTVSYISMISTLFLCCSLLYPVAFYSARFEHGLVTPQMTLISFILLFFCNKMHQQIECVVVEIDSHCLDPSGSNISFFHIFLQLLENMELRAGRVRQGSREHITSL